MYHGSINQITDTSKFYDKPKDLEALGIQHKSYRNGENKQSEDGLDTLEDALHDLQNRRGIDKQQAKNELDSITDLEELNYSHIPLYNKNSFPSKKIS